MKNRIIKIFLYLCAVFLLASCVQSLMDGNIPMAALDAAGTLAWIYIVSVTIDNDKEDE